MRRSILGIRAKSFRPNSERLETRRLLSYADGNGAVITGLTEQLDPSRKTLVINFDGPLEQSQAELTANYRVNALLPSVSPEIVTKNGASDRVLSAVYNASTYQVTLTLAKP